MQPVSNPIAPAGLTEIEVPLSRRIGWRHLRQMPRGIAFCCVVTCEVERYGNFVQRCLDSRCRPPSQYAYFARCLGVVLADKTELLTVRHRNKLLVPQRVDVAVMVEIKGHDGSATPCFVTIQDVGNRSLQVIAADLDARVRQRKRQKTGACFARFPLCASQFAGLVARVRAESADFAS